MKTFDKLLKSIPARNYAKTECLVLSPFQVEFLENLVKNYDPEPWETDMRTALLNDLKSLKHPEYN